ncbi:MAG: hypothetical protein ACTS3F_07170 [Phycisphaerales bacterium]
MARQILPAIGLAWGLAIGSPGAVAQPGGSGQGAQAGQVGTPQRAMTYITVSGEQPVSLRCGSQDIWYAVVEVPPGTVLAGDQQLGTGWWSVAYPGGVPVVVPVEEGRLVNPTGPVEITEPSTLKAFNMMEPVREECYRRVLAEQLRPGARLRFIRTINDREGNVGGYLVHPPSEARLWIDGRSVRSATQAEVDGYMAAQRARQEEAEAPQAPPEEPVGGQDAPDEGSPAEMDPVSPGDGDAEGDARAGESGDAEGAGSDERPTGAGGQAGAADTGDAVGEEGPDSEPEAPEATPAERAAARISALDIALQSTVRAPLETAEFDQLINRYQQAGRSLDADSDPDGALARAIGERVALLELRSELQAAQRELLAIKESGTEVDQRNQELLERARATRRYSVVGRLSTSTVYDGVALPRLLRIVSVEGDRGRTLAYLAPGEEQNFDLLLGRIVGVSAPPPAESNARVPILVPSAVDALDAEQR